MTDMDAILDAAFAKAGVTLPSQYKDSEFSRLRAMDDTAQLTKAVTIGSPSWRDLVAMKLVHGYGVEDIALWLRCHRSHVAAEVKRLRAAGRFKAWWGK